MMINCDLLVGFSLFSYFLHVCLLMLPYFSQSMSNRKHSLPCIHCQGFHSSHSSLYICKRFCFFRRGGVSGVDIFKRAGAAASVTWQPETGPDRTGHTETSEVCPLDLASGPRYKGPTKMKLAALNISCVLFYSLCSFDECVTDVYETFTKIRNLHPVLNQYGTQQLIVK